MGLYDTFWCIFSLILTHFRLSSAFRFTAQVQPPSSRPLDILARRPPPRRPPLLANLHDRLPPERRDIFPRAVFLFPPLLCSVADVGARPLAFRRATKVVICSRGSGSVLEVSPGAAARGAGGDDRADHVGRARDNGRGALHERGQRAGVSLAQHEGRGDLG